MLPIILPTKKNMELVNQSVKTLGFEINVLVPSTVEDFDTLAGNKGSALKSAIMNVIYRSVLATFRSDFCDKLEEVTKLARPTRDTGKTRKVKTEAADGTVTETEEAILVWAKTESEYFDIVVATIAKEQGKTMEEVIASFKDLADQVAAAIKFDPSESAPSTAGPKKIAKQYLDTAQTIITAGGAEKVAAKLSALLNKTVTPDLEGLARAIAEDQANKRKQLAAEYSA